MMGHGGKKDQLINNNMTKIVTSGPPCDLTGLKEEKSNWKWLGHV